jgi:hypothetical protein
VKKVAALQQNSSTLETRLVATAVIQAKLVTAQLAHPVAHQLFDFNSHFFI